MTFCKFINHFRKLLLYFSYTIPHKVVFKNFTFFLRTVNLRNNSLLVRTTSIACTIPCQILFVPNLILVGVVLGRSLADNTALNLFTKPGEVITY